MVWGLGKHYVNKMSPQRYENTTVCVCYLYQSLPSVSSLLPFHFHCIMIGVLFVCSSLNLANLPFKLLPVQPMEIFVDDETKLTLHGLQQYYVKLKDNEKNRKLFDLLDALEFNQVPTPYFPHSVTPLWTFLFCLFAFLLMGIRLLRFMFMSYKHVTVGHTCRSC